MFRDDSSPHVAVRSAGVCVTYSDLGDCVCIHAYVM